MEEANLQERTSIAPPTPISSDTHTPAPSTSHEDCQVAQAQKDEAAQQQSSSYKASEIATRFIEVMDPNASKSHVDTAAPIDSVKGAVTKFGGILDRREKQRKQGQDELDMVNTVQEEVTDCHKRSVSAEAARSQALLELGRTASAADKLRLSLQRAQVEDAQARQEAELAGRRLGELQRAAGERAAAKVELDAVGARRAAAVAELQAARAKVESMDKVRAAAVAEADKAVARAREAAAESHETGKAVEDLAAVLVALKGDLESSHAAHVEAEERRLRLALALEEDKTQWQMELEEAQQEAKRLRGELVAACELEMKAEAASKLLANLKAELEKPVMSSSSQQPIMVQLDKAKKEVEEVKASVERAKGEAECLRVAAATMRDLLDKEKAELAVLRRREGLSTASIIPSLQEQLRRATSEVAVAEAAAKADAAQHHQQQVGEARREAEEAKAKARCAREAVARAREEAGVAKAAVATVEARLEAVAREILAATTSEEMAMASAAALMQECSNPPPSRKSSEQSNKDSAGVTLRMEEYEELSRRARETEEVAGKRVMEAVKLIKEAKDAEVRSLEKLAKAGRQTEQRRQALEASTLEAEDAEFERMSAERELRQWRADHQQTGSPRAGLAEISVRGDRSAAGNPHILNPRGGYMMPRTDLMTAEADAARQRKTTFFPRMVMFLARRRAQASWK